MQAIPLSQHIPWLGYVKLLRTFFPPPASLLVVDEYRLRVWEVVPHSSLVREEGETAQSSVEESCLNAPDPKSPRVVLATSVVASLLVDRVESAV